MRRVVLGVVFALVAWTAQADNKLVVAPAPTSMTQRSTVTNTTMFGRAAAAVAINTTLIADRIDARGPATRKAIGPQFGRRTMAPSLSARMRS